MAEPMTTTISGWFEEHGDFPENYVEEHAFVPGNGEDQFTDVCQFTGCGMPISQHEEGEPCCYPYFTTRGEQHAFGCPDDPATVRPATFNHGSTHYDYSDEDRAADAYERFLGY